MFRPTKREVILTALLGAAVEMSFAPRLNAQATRRGVEKVLKWEGEKVVILKSNQPTIFADCTQRRSDSAEPPYAKYGGMTGVITKSETGANTPRGFQLTITLDGTAESLILCNDEPLGFFSELDSARKLIGKQLWTKGQRFLKPPSGPSVLIDNTERLTVTKVDWKNAGEPIEFFFRTDKGLEGSLEKSFVGQGYADGIDQRFHASSRGAGGPFLSQFHMQDPRKTYPAWTASTWKTIRQGQVTVGMTSAMVDMTCGNGVVVEGVILGAKGTTGRVLRCEFSLNFFKRFDVVDGKVKRVDDR